MRERVERDKSDGSIPSATAAVARAGGAAVEDVLHGQVDVDPLGLPRDLDAVAERADGAVRPAGAAVCASTASAPTVKREREPQRGRDGEPYTVGCAG